MTGTGVKCSQLRREGSPQKVHTEYEGYAGAHIPARIAETDNTNATESKIGLLEAIVSRDNLNEAFKRVKAKKGSHGIDRMGVDGFYNISKNTGKRSSNPF